MIRFRFASRRGLGDAVIRWYAAGLGWRYGWAHVGAMRSMAGGEYEFGARVGVDRSVTGRPGVQYRPADYAEFLHHEFVDVPGDAEAFWREAARIDGAPYSGLTILGYALGGGLRDDDGFDCSAAMPYLLYRIGMLPRELVAAERRLTPQGFYYLCLGLREGNQIGIEREHAIR